MIPDPFFLAFDSAGACGGGVALFAGVFCVAAALRAAASRAAAAALRAAMNLPASVRERPFSSRTTVVGRGSPSMMTCWRSLLMYVSSKTSSTGPLGVGTVTLSPRLRSGWRPFQ